MYQFWPLHSWQFISPTATESSIAKLFWITADVVSVILSNKSGIEHQGSDNMRWQNNKTGSQVWQPSWNKMMNFIQLIFYLYKVSIAVTGAASDILI